MSETPMADEYPPCDYCEHRDKPPVAEPCIDCERESAGKWSEYVPIFKVPAWGDVLHYLSTHRLWGLARVVNDGMTRIRELERDLAAERERADRAKAEGIKEGMRVAADIAEQHASVEGIAQRIRKLGREPINLAEKVTR